MSNSWNFTLMLNNNLYRKWSHALFFWIKKTWFLKKYVSSFFGDNKVIKSINIEYHLNSY